MSTLVVVFRIISLMAFAGPMSFLATARRGRLGGRTRRSGGDQAPVVANVASFVLFFASLFVCAGGVAGFTALMMAASGSLLALAGAALVLRSRAELGAAWSLVPEADQRTGLVTTGPYRLVRHPIYLGLSILAVGQALAFGSAPALIIVLFACVPTFALRARAEEKLLTCIFGDRYADYRRRTRMIIPYVL